MIGGHLGADIAPLLDGQLTREATALAWQHVADCPQCSAEVERQAWVKAKLRNLPPSVGASDSLKQSLKNSGADTVIAYPVVQAHDASAAPGPLVSRRMMYLFGLSLVSIAVVTIFSLTSAPANAPAQPDRRLPTVIVTPSEVPSTTRGDRRDALTR